MYKSKSWKTFRKKYGLHDFTDPIVHARAVLDTMEPKERAEYLKELLECLGAYQETCES